MNTIVKIHKEEDGWTYIYKEFGKTYGIRVTSESQMGNAKRMLLNTVAMFKFISEKFGENDIKDFDKLIISHCPTPEDHTWAKENVTFETTTTPIWEKELATA